MAFTEADAAKHFPRCRGHGVATRQWVHVANRYLDKGYPEKDAIEVANGVVEKRSDLSDAPGPGEGDDRGNEDVNKGEDW